MLPHKPELQRTPVLYGLMVSMVREGRNVLTLSNISRPSESFHECGNEILHRLRPSDKHKQQTLTPYSPITNAHLESCPMWHGRAMSTLCKSNTINSKSITCQHLFLFIQESPTVRRIIWKQEKDNNRGDDRCDAFKDLQSQQNQKSETNSQKAISILANQQLRPYIE